MSVYDKYRDLGYVIMQGVLSARELGDYRRECGRLVALCKDPATRPLRAHIQWEVDFLPGTYSEQAGGLIRMITPVVGDDISPAFTELARNSLITAAAEATLGEPLEIFESKLNLKPPGGSGFVWHQDWSCCWRAHTDELVTCLLYLDEATTENGCLQVVPESHKGKRCLPFRSNRFEGDTFEVDPRSFDHRRGMALPLKAGDMIIFDPYLLHYSARNRSVTWRRAILYTYNPARLGKLTDGFGHN